MVTMPRAKKLPGQAVDQRNGMRSALPAVQLGKFGLPKREDGQKYELRTQRMWRALWDDQRLTAALSPVDRELVIRWALSVDDWIKALNEARKDPIVPGRNDQPVASPYFAIAAQAMAVAAECEKQIGIGALNRARLGIAILTEARTLADLSAAFPGDSGGDDDRYADPR